MNFSKAIGQFSTSILQSFFPESEERNTHQSINWLSKIFGTFKKKICLKEEYSICSNCFKATIKACFESLKSFKVLWTEFLIYFSIAFRVVASLFCKSAKAYNPFIYYFLSKGFRLVKNKVKWKKSFIITSNLFFIFLLKFSHESCTKYSNNKELIRYR